METAFNHRQYPWYSFIKLSRIISQMKTWMLNDEEHIFYREFLLKKNITSQHITEASKVYNFVRDAVKWAKEMQEIKLCLRCSNGKINSSAFSKLIDRYHAVEHEEQEIITRVYLPGYEEE